MDSQSKTAHNPTVAVGTRVKYYTGGLHGSVTAVQHRGVVMLVSVKWDNGAPDLGPYVIGQRHSSVRLA